MFCRYCGRQLQDESEFCSYCGKQQSAVSVEKNIINTSDHKRQKGMDMHTLSTVASIIFYLGIVVFLILFLKMAPGYGSQAFLAYCICAAVTIVCAVIIHKIRSYAFTKSRELIALFFGLLLLIPSVGLRIVYETKVDDVKAYYPQAGSISVHITVDEKLYSSGAGFVKSPYSYFSIGGNKYRGGATLQVDVNKSYTMELGAGHKGADTESGFSIARIPEDSGKTTTNITFSKRNLSGGFSQTKRVSLSHGLYADVTVKIERVCDFWEVIMH